MHFACVGVGVGSGGLSSSVIGIRADSSLIVCGASSVIRGPLWLALARGWSTLVPPVMSGSTRALVVGWSHYPKAQLS